MGFLFPTIHCFWVYVAWVAWSCRGCFGVWKLLREVRALYFMHGCKVSIWHTNLEVHKLTVTSVKQSTMGEPRAIAAPESVGLSALLLPASGLEPWWVLATLLGRTQHPSGMVASRWVVAPTGVCHLEGRVFPSFHVNWDSSSLVLSILASVGSSGRACPPGTLPQRGHLHRAGCWAGELKASLLLRMFKKQDVSYRQILNVLMRSLH